MVLEVFPLLQKSLSAICLSLVLSTTSASSKNLDYNVGIRLMAAQMGCEVYQEIHEQAELFARLGMLEKWKQDYSKKFLETPTDMSPKQTLTALALVLRYIDTVFDTEIQQFDDNVCLSFVYTQLSKAYWDDDLLHLFDNNKGLQDQLTNETHIKAHVKKETIVCGLALKLWDFTCPNSK